MFNRKYLREPRLNHTGFLANDSVIRMKQNLSPQELSNNCQFLEPDSINKGLVERSGGYCNQKLLYPFPAVPIIYDQGIEFQKYPVKPETNYLPSLSQRKEIPMNFVKLNSRNQFVSGEIPDCCNCAQWVMPI